MTDSPAQSTPIGQTALSGLPRDVDGATELLRNLGYENAKAYRVEVDRIIAVVNSRALTFVFQVEGREEQVRISEVEGWPAE
jgi:hypothetical protein